MPNARTANAVRLECAADSLVRRAQDGRKAHWLVLYDAPGADRKDGEHAVFGDLLRRD